MRRLLILTARLAVVFWCGAAIMFVVTAVQEVRSPDFDSVTKAKLAILRFPTYYKFAGACLAVGSVTSVLAALLAGPARRRLFVASATLLIATGLTVYDYFRIYKPLETMTANVRVARPAEFDTYHERSRMINTVDVSLCLFAGVLLCWPLPAVRADDEARTS